MELIKKNNLKELKKIITFKKYEKILIVAGATSFFTSKVNIIIDKFTQNKKTLIFFKKKKLPEIEELQSLIDTIKNFNPNLIISIGGGAVLDLAKVANSLVFEKNIKKNIVNNSYTTNNFCELLAVPMTAGTGAEVTTNAVIYIKNKKFSVEGELVKPTHMALLPELIIRNKKKNIITSSAFDCFAQSVESMFSKRSNQKSVNFSKKSIKIFLGNYKKFMSNRSIDKAYSMCLASYYSGKAISISKTIAPHAVSYPFTSYFNVDHGHAVSLTFESFLEHNFNNLEYSTSNFNLEERYKILFNLLNVKNIFELVKKIKIIKKDLSLKDKLSSINSKIPNNLNLIVKDVNLQRLNNNPIDIQKKDIINILKKIS
jgi:alcohol dehydrogenase